MREECHTVVVAPLNPCNLTVNFADSAFGTSVYFVNQSTPLANTDSISWTFGDGTSSTAINPFHVYNAPGTYTVCLRIIKPQTSSSEACIREFCKPVIVSTQSTVCDQLQVNFGWQIDQTNNRRFLFTNQSSPVTANTYTSWSFGDGDSSTAYNPAHTYAQPGTYLVCLRVGIPGTNCVRDTCRTVVVSPTIDSCHIQPAFISHADSFNNRTITFINTTAGASATSYAEWTFGDGTANTGWNISHTYAVPGWYLVCFTK